MTEELASTACDLGNNLPEDAKGGIEVDPITGTVTADEEECDWSAEDSDVEV